MSNREAANVKLDDIINKPLIKTGSEIPPGSYAGTLIAFSEPFMVPIAERFLNGKPSGSKQMVFEAIFAIKVKSNLERVEYLLSPPDGGKIGIKSNLYKMLRSLGPDLIDGEGNFAKDVKLSSFVSRHGTVEVEKQTKNENFVKVAKVAAGIDGLVYPTMEEGKPLLDAPSASDNVPF